MSWRTFVASCVFCTTTPSLAPAQVPLPLPPAGVVTSTEYGVEYSTIGAPGNQAHPAIPGASFDPRLVGRDFGAVPYTYRLSRTEVTTGQWLEFVNTFSTQASFPTELWQLPAFTEETPLFWGATNDPTYSGPGVRYRLVPSVTTAASIPVGGISWRDAALYCNWLSNGKSGDPASLWNGAYDTATFGASGGAYTDQTTHSPGARFWIPSYDEWAKAMFYDANLPGGGYWDFATSSSASPVYAPPPTGTANAGFSLGNFQEFAIPVASYPNAQSPWGMFDGAGSRVEWTETARPPEGGALRWVAGSAAQTFSVPDFDTIGHIRSLGPGLRLGDGGFRIATTIPSPTTAGFALLLTLDMLRQFRRREQCAPFPYCFSA